MNDTKFDEILVEHVPNRNLNTKKPSYSFSSSCSYNDMLREKYLKIDKKALKLKNANRVKTETNSSNAKKSTPSQNTTPVGKNLKNEFNQSTPTDSSNNVKLNEKFAAETNEKDYLSLSDEECNTPNFKKRLSSPSQNVPNNEKVTPVSKRHKNAKDKSNSKTLTNDKSEDSNLSYKSNIPNRYSDFGGIENTIKEIRELVNFPLLHPEIFKHLGVSIPRGILLYGPPGCGKTQLAMAIAGEINVPFFQISSPEIVSGISGESETKIRKIFEEAKSVAPSIIFFDEIDCITSKKESGSKEMEKRIMAQLLISIDELKNSLVIVIGATSKIDLIDPSFRRSGRFDREINLSVPNEDARIKILKTICANLQIDGEFDYELIASRTPGYVGSDLQALTREAANIAINRIFNTHFNDSRDHTAPVETEKPDQPSDGICVDLKTPFTEEQLSQLSINMDDFIRALDKVQPSVKREGFVTTSKFTWDDVGALEEVKKKIQTYILEPLKYKKEFEKLNIVSPTGVILYGPPGCGKTLLAKVIANETQANFISVKGPELLNKFLGESERSIRNLFDKARLSSPCIIFFDEIDALVPKRTGSENMNSDRIVNQILVELDGLEERNQVFVIAATNRPDIIDPAILRPGRIDKLLYVPLPNSYERYLILKAHVKDMPLDPDVDLYSIAVDKASEGYSGADLKLLIKEASYFALEQHISCGKHLALTQEHFKAALQKVVCSVSVNERNKYENLNLKYKG